MKQKDVFFPVKKVPCKDIMGDSYNFANRFTHAIVAETPNGPHIVNFCSENYSLVSNEEVVKPFQKELKKWYDIDLKIRGNGLSRFFFEFILKDKGLSVDSKDKIFPKITLVNSYDGSIKYQFQMGMYRLVCSNGLTIPAGEVKGIKKMHTPSVEKSTNYESIMEMSAEFLASSKDVLGFYKELQSKKVSSVEERVQEIGDNTKFPSRQLENVLVSISEERVELGIKDYNDWLVYNGFNRQLNHSEEISLPIHKKEKIDQQILEYIAS